MPFEHGPGFKAISPTMTYRLAATAPDLTECEEATCTTDFGFQWLHDRNCKFAFVCSNLTGNVCGSYGLDVERNGEVKSVCFPGQGVEMELNFYEKVSVKLWHLKDAAFDMECMLWCSVDGILPEEHVASDVDTRLIDSLVSLDQTSGLFAQRG